MPRGRDAVGRRRLVILLGFITLVLGVTAVLTLAPTPWLTLLAVVEVTGASSLASPARWSAAELRFAGACRPTRREFAVYFASTVGADYQVGMWLPYFLRIGRPFVIVTRTAPMLRRDRSDLCRARRHGAARSTGRPCAASRRSSSTR